MSLLYVRLTKPYSSTVCFYYDMGKICGYVVYKFSFVIIYELLIVLKTRSSESDGRSDVTDSLDCPDKFRLP